MTADWPKRKAAFDDEHAKWERAAATAKAEGKVSSADLWLHVNEMPVGQARELREMAVEGKHVRAAVFAVPAAALRDGANRLFFRNEGEPLTVLAVEVRVG